MEQHGDTQIYSAHISNGNRVQIGDPGVEEQRVVKHWPKDAVKCPALKIFKTWLDKALKNLL